MEDDPEFEVTAEMLVHQDLDDEATLEEEEAATQPEDVQEELAGLEQEGEMPLEQLLALYGYRGDALAEEGAQRSPARNGALSEGFPSLSPHGEQIFGEPPGGHTCDNPPEHPKPPQSPSTDANDPHPHLLSPAHMEGWGLSVELVEPDPSAELSVAPSLHDPEAIVAPIDPVCGTGDKGSRVLVEETPTKVIPSGSCSPHKRGRPPRGEEGKYRLRPEVGGRRSTRLMQNEAAAVEAYFASVLEGGCDDDDEEGTSNEDWKRDVKVGPDHQAEVSVQPTHSPYSYDTYGDKVVWKPDGIDENEVSRYLAAVSEQITGHPPPTTSPHDDERALEILQRFHHDTQHALKWIRTKGLPGGTTPWTEEECKRFEAGLRTVGKDFNALSKQLNTRTLKELVEFYYVWTNKLHTS